MSENAPESGGKPSRGKACLNCRRRKMRCDGTKPTCGPCNRRTDDCEYTDRPGPTRTQALEEHISFLESRIRDLENPLETSSSVFLADPYASTPQVQQPATYSGAEPDMEMSREQRMAFELPSLPDSWWDLEEPPVQLRQTLMDYFLPYTLVTGFFLNVPRFINSLYSPGLLGDHARPCPALLSTVYLWGLKLSASDLLTVYEPVFLARAIRHVSSGLSIDHPQKAKHAIQAEALLSHYFYWCGRVLEGRYHCNAAVSIAISLGSHRIRSSRGPISIPASVDPIEEGERINSFWAVFINDKCWSIAMNVSSALPDHKALNGRIDTPWPLDMAQYEKGFLTSDIRGHSTVQTFLDDPGAPGEETSVLASSCKAAALLDRVTRFVATWKPNLPEAIMSKFYSDFLALDQGLDAFHVKIPKVLALGDVDLQHMRSLVLVHTILHVASIHLNVIFAHQEANANRKCIDAATAAIRLFDEVDLTRLGFVPLIMGSLWLTCGQVIIREVVRVREMETSDVLARLTREEELVKLLDRLEFVVLSLGVKAPIFGLQYDLLVKSRSEISEQM